MPIKWFEDEVEVERAIEMVRIMIADDHALIRRVVREIVENESDMQVVAEARNGHEAETQAAETHPDVALIDLDMPDYDGFEATERVLACSPNTHVVMLSASQQEQYAFHAIQRGAIGYLTKDIEPDALVYAIRCAARDELCIPGPLATRVLAHLRSLTFGNNFSEVYSGVQPSTPPPMSILHCKVPQIFASPVTSTQGTTRPLTERENEVLELIRKGRKNREIARELQIAESTVHKHIQNIFEKLHARSRTEAIYLMNTRA